MLAAGFHWFFGKSGDREMLAFLSKNLGKFSTEEFLFETDG